jgi:fibronectin type 3 domain-containing protein
LISGPELLIDLTFTDPNVLNNTQYTYHVTAVFFINVSSANSNAVSVTRDVNPPRNLAYHFNYEGHVVLNWETPEGCNEHITAYWVYKYALAELVQTYTQNFERGMEFVDANIQEGVEYTYYVVAVYFESIKSPHSNSVSVKRVINPPRNLVAEKGRVDGIPAITLTWRAPALGYSLELTHYAIIRNDEDYAVTYPRPCPRGT